MALEPFILLQKLTFEANSFTAAFYIRTWASGVRCPRADCARVTFSFEAELELPFFRPFTEFGKKRLWLSENRYFCLVATARINISSVALSPPSFLKFSFTLLGKEPSLLRNRITKIFSVLGPLLDDFKNFFHNSACDSCFCAPGQLLKTFDSSMRVNETDDKLYYSITMFHPTLIKLNLTFSF